MRETLTNLNKATLLKGLVKAKAMKNNDELESLVIVAHDLTI
jgi:hypothetical protein